MNITFEEFKKLDIRIGEILKAEKVGNADKLLKLEVDFGPSVDSASSPQVGHSTLRDKSSSSDSKSSGSLRRQIISGIAQWYEPENLVGKKLPFIVNLEPRIFRGHESQGMLIAVNSDNKAIILEPQGEVKPGDKIV